MRRKGRGPTTSNNQARYFRGTDGPR